MSRLTCRTSITRRKTFPSYVPGLALSWHFEAFKVPKAPDILHIPIPYKQGFVDIAAECSDQFFALRCVDIPLSGSGRPQAGRCLQGMPSFRYQDKTFLSPQAPSQRYIRLEDFIPCYMDGEILRYGSNKNPSVDAPIHLALYQPLPMINYILHAHDYIDGAPFTATSIPCGAIEEIDEIMQAIRKHYGDTNQNVYKPNLRGPSSFLMGATVADLYNVHYVARQLPEIMEVEYEF